MIESTTCPSCGRDVVPYTAPRWDERYNSLYHEWEAVVVEEARCPKCEAILAGKPDRERRVGP